MPDADLLDLFTAQNEPDALAKQQALAAALKRQRGAGLLGQLSGDKVLAPLGQSQIEDADTQQRLASTAGNQRLSRALDAQRLKQQGDYQNAEIGIARQRAAQDNDVPIQTGNGVVLLNKRTGATRQLLGADGVPVPPKGRGALGVGGLDKNTENEFLKLNDSVSTTKGRANLAKGYQQSLDRAQRLEALLKLPDGSLVNATPQQLREASTSLASLISGGGPGALAQIEELTPETYASKFANFKQKLLNEPQGADAQAFLQNMLDTAKRESDLARKQMRAAQLQGLPAFAPLRKVDKGRFDSILQGAGLDPSTIDDNGLLAQPSAPQAAASTSSGARMMEMNGKRKLVPAEQVAAWAAKGAKVVD